MNAPLPESIRLALENVTLDDKYSRQQGRIYLSGVQALVRLPLMQQMRDQMQQTAEAVQAASEEKAEEAKAAGKRGRK